MPLLLNSREIHSLTHTDHEPRTTTSTAVNYSTQRRQLKRKHYDTGNHESGVQCFIVVGYGYFLAGNQT